MQQFTTQELSDLLRETEQEHAKAEKDLPSSHAWQDWYGAYLGWRMKGEIYTREDGAFYATSYVLNKWADDLNSPKPATNDGGVTILDGQKGYTTLQGIAGIAGIVLIIVGLIVLLTPSIG